VASAPTLDVSVLIRTRDRPRLLAEALESVARQTRAPLEVVVVNDGGEPVGHILASFAKRLTIRHVTHPEALGRAAAANAGVRLAQGELVALLDDDDLFLPTHLQTLADALAGSGAELAHAACRLVRPDGEEVMATPADREALLLANTIPTCAALVSRQAILAVGGFDETLPFLEDWDLWIRLAQRRAFVFVNQVTSVYRAGPASVGGAMAAERWQVMERLFAKHWPRLTPATLVRRLYQLERDIGELRRQAAEVRRWAAELEADNGRLREETRFIRELAEAGLLGPTWWLHRAWRRWRRWRGREPV
jgi:glycosyltransferase involved in cell wall biosynthesis